MGGLRARPGAQSLALPHRGRDLGVRHPLRARSGALCSCDGALGGWRVAGHDEIRYGGELPSHSLGHRHEPAKLGAGEAVGYDSRRGSAMTLRQLLWARWARRRRWAWRLGWRARGRGGARRCAWCLRASSASSSPSGSSGCDRFAPPTTSYAASGSPPRPSVVHHCGHCGHGGYGVTLSLGHRGARGRPGRAHLVALAAGD
jgi:hypothetical protein